MEEHGAMLRAPHLAIRPEPARGSYEAESESDTASTTSSTSSLDDVPRGSRPKKVGPLFIDATIAQDDTRGKTAKAVQMLADMGLELAAKGITLRSDADNEAMRRGYLGALSLLPPPSFNQVTPPVLPLGGRGPGGLPPRIPLLWPIDKVDLKSAWRLDLARHRGTATTGPGAGSDTKTATHMERQGTESAASSESKKQEETDKVSTQHAEHDKSEAVSEAPGLAEVLGDVADRYLHIDVLDHSQDLPGYIGYLLDTIHSLHSRLIYKSSRNLGSETEKDLSIAKERAPRSQVLHKVVCYVSWHNHNNFFYEDEPTYQTAESTHDYKGISGNVPVANVRYYVEQNPDIAFIILKEHECGQSQRRREVHLNHSDDDRVSERKEIIQIISTDLSETLKRIADFEPFDDDSRGEDVFVGKMEAPYLFLFHHYQKLQESMAHDSAHRPILDPLVQFLEQNYAEEYRSANELFDRGFVTAFHAAKLYKPLDVLVARKSHNEAPRCHVLRLLPERSASDKRKWFLEGWSWSYNGREARRKKWAQYTDAFQAEEVPITKLPVYPLRYAKPEDAENLRETGRRFWSMRHQGLRCYTGWDNKLDRYYFNERFMVDVATYYVMYESSSPRANGSDSIYDRWPDTVDNKEEMPLDCELLLPNAIEGFHLGSKKWVVLNVNDFLPGVDWNKNAFKQLVLDDKTKEMIRALVEVHTSRDNAMDDIIKGKGTGLILLLHGSPGTGKTLTAESVAEIAEKPLYRVTCGDIGTNAQEVEKYLQTVMYLGKIWDCVLLLDEADVFLEERTMADLARNSLVSVFLRILEYHEGILILTSNRVGTFDEAFKSRIQVAIHYDNLTRKSRKAIWRNFFDMIEETGEDANMPELEGRLNELASEEMNGRQIRNALLTARQLAQHRKERLDWGHLDQVIKTSAAFNKYLKTVKGHTDEKWAREEGIR